MSENNRNKKITIPLRNYKDKRGGRVPEGTYRAITEDAEVGQTKGGDVMITLYFRIIGGEYDGTTIIDRLFPAMEKAQWRTVAFLQAAGIPTPRKDFQIELGKFLNRTMDVELADGEPYNGNIRSEVRGYAKVAKADQPVEEDVEDVTTDDDAPAPSAASPVEDIDVDLDDIEEV